MGIKNMKEADFRDNETLDLFKQTGGNVLLTSIDAVIDWGRSNSIWPLTFATSCCGIEMMATGASRYDWARFGFEVPSASPRRADLMIVAGNTSFQHFEAYQFFCNAICFLFFKMWPVGKIFGEFCYPAQPGFQW